MTDQTVNIPLLRKAVEWAEAEAAKPPALCEWEQGYYVLPITIDDPLVAPMGSSDSDWVKLARRDKAPECGTCYCIAGFAAAQSGMEWYYHTAESVATVELGLKQHEAEELFAGGNSIADVRRIAEQIAGERL